MGRLLLVVVLLAACAVDSPQADETGAAWFFGIVIAVVVLVGIAAVIGGIWHRRQMIREEGAADAIQAGTYVTGHPSIFSPTDVMIGTKGADVLIFASRDGTRLGRIPSASILGLEVLDKTRVETDKAFTLTRAAILGVWALAVPKTTTTVTPQFLLAVTWDAGGVRQSTYFSFASANAANSVAGYISQGRAGGQSFA